MTKSAASSPKAEPRAGAPGRFKRAVAASLGFGRRIRKSRRRNGRRCPGSRGLYSSAGAIFDVRPADRRLAVFAAWLVGRAITRRAIAPLEDVAVALRRIGGGNFSPEPLHNDDGSLRDLTAAYNEVAHRLTIATVERERNELQMQQFIADAGHELRTPLTIVMGYLEILQQGVVGDPAAIGQVYETMLAQSRRMRASIEKLILLARLERPAPPRTEAVDVGALAERAAEAFRPLAGTDRIAVTLAASPCVVKADESELYEAMKNVIENAVRYAPDSPIPVTYR